MAQDAAVSEITRVREPPRSEKVETSETKSDAVATTGDEPAEKAGGNETGDSTEHREESSTSSTSDIDGRGDNVDIVV